MANELAVQMRSQVVSAVTDVVQDVRRAEQTTGDTLPGNKTNSDANLAPILVNPQKAVEHLRVLAQQIKRELRFSVDDTSGRVVIRVIDAFTGDTVRSIPADEAEALIANHNETKGLLFGGSV